MDRTWRRPRRGSSYRRGDETDAFAQRVVERVKELEHEGFQFEAADGSFELLMRKEAGAYEPLFRLESWRVLVEKRTDGKVITEATIKGWVKGERFVRTAEGNGPVHALDAALRDAIGDEHLPRAVRASARRVSAVRDRGRPLACAAVLPGDGRAGVGAGGQGTREDPERPVPPPRSAVWG
jgi:hypothetical protein